MNQGLDRSSKVVAHRSARPEQWPRNKPAPSTETDHAAPSTAAAPPPKLLPFVGVRAMFPHHYVPVDQGKLLQTTTQSEMFIGPNLAIKLEGKKWAKLPHP